MQRVTLRPRFSMVLAVAIAVMGALGIASLVAAGDVDGLLRYTPGVLLVVWLVWVGFWLPAVVIAEDAVSVRNPFRTVTVPWGAIQRVDTRWALRLITSGGSFTAWSAPAPSRYAITRATRDETRGLPESTFGAGGTIGIGDIPASESGLAAYHVRRHWEQLRDAGELDARDGRVAIRWEWLRIGAVAVLAALTATGALIP